MERRSRFFVGVVVAVLLILLVFFAVSNSALVNREGDASSSIDIPSFVDCLNKKGVVVYGTQNDTNSNIQLGLFENSSKNLNFIDCTTASEACQGIIIYPTWKINGVIIHGSLSLNILSRFSGCSLN